MADINDYLISLHLNVKEKSLSDEGDYEEQVFLDEAASILIDCEEIEEAMPCYYRHPTLGIQVNGYYFNEVLDCLDLFVVEYDGRNEQKNLLKRTRESCFNRATKFFFKATDGFHQTIEEASEGYDLAQEIYVRKNEITQVRIYLITDLSSKETQVLREEKNNIMFSYHMCDIDRIFRLGTSGTDREPILIDFANEHDTPLSCLKMPKENGVYSTYLSVVPASLLAKIYDKYGPRLLEKNVRTFLQLRGKVNKGLRETINKEPDMFLAYNNGLTITVKDLTARNGTGNYYEILDVKDFQVVNGGQTTASIYHTFKKDKASLDNVFVQAKINHIIDDSITDDLTSKISLYANSQNKINAADFSSNDPYHVALETLSRKLWAPPQEDSIVNTRWFYERARGQYNDELNRLNTPAQKRDWKLRHPSLQKFTKTDLAKYLNTWKQLPHVVSKGAQYNFKELMIDINHLRDVPDEVEFKRIIAKAILFKKADTVIRKQNYGDYKAQNVTYTLSYLCHASGSRVNLDQIWKDQNITQSLEDCIKEISASFFSYLMGIAASGKNASQFCKKKECWDGFKKNCSYKLSDALEKELIDLAVVNSIEQEIPADDDLKLVEWTVSFGEPFWKKISRWGKLTKCLQGWQNGIAYSVGKAIDKKGSVSVKQARQAKVIYNIAEKYGFEEINKMVPDEVDLSVTVSNVRDHLASLPKVRIHLIDNSGNLPSKSGLNWGQRKGRDANQAYLPVRTSECNDDFFPERGTEFTLYTDDNKEIKCVRAQANGKAIHSLNNSELGLYFRSRFSLISGQKICETHLNDYGRTHIDIYKIENTKYFMDFSV